MTDMVQASFAYSDIAPDLALELRMSAERIRMRMKRTAEDIVAIGQELSEAQSKLAKQGNGKFLGWIHEEFDMGKSTAYQFINVFERFGNKDLPNFGRISLSVLYQLAAPATSEQIVERVISGGIPANRDAIKEAIAEEKAAREEAEAQLQAQQQQVMQLMGNSSNLTHKLYEASQRITDLQNTIKTLEDSQVKDAKKRIATLEHTISELANQQPETIKVEVPDPKVVAELEAKRTALTQAEKQRDELQSYLERIKTELASTRDDRRIAAQHQRIRQEWQTKRSKLLGALKEFALVFPTSQDTQEFEGDDWQQLDELVSAIERTKHELQALKQGGRVIDMMEAS